MALAAFDSETKMESNSPSSPGFPQPPMSESRFQDQDVSSGLIPEGGWGWAICAASFVVQFIVMGIHNSFGILYTELLVNYKRSKAETAWVGSVSVGIMFLFGPITSGLCERLGCRTVATIGGVLSILGLLLTSFMTDLYKIYVTYGFLWGIGSSFCYFPTLTIPGEYFCRRLSLVNGIITAGSGLGTLTIGPLLQHFLEISGLATSMRMLSAFAAVLLVAPLTYKPFRSPLMEIYNIQRTPAPFIDLIIWRNKAFLTYTLAVMVFMLGYFIPLIHLVNHVEGLGVLPSRAALLVGYMSIASTISRLVLGRFSDHPKVNRLYLTQVAMMGFGITTTLFPLIRRYVAFVAAVVALGLFEGLYVVLIAVLNTDIVGIHMLPRALGGLYGVISLGIIIGPPCAGLIYDELHSYHAAFYICGATTTLATCLLFLVPWLLPNSRGGKFHRDSCASRVENLLLKSNEGLPKSRDCTTSLEADVHSSFSSTGSLNTSFNTIMNSSMSRRGSIARTLLAQQSGSRTESATDRSRRGESGDNAVTTLNNLQLLSRLQASLDQEAIEEVRETVV